MKSDAAEALCGHLANDIRCIAMSEAGAPLQLKATRLRRAVVNREELDEVL